MALVKEKFTFVIESDFEEIDDELWLQVKEDPNKFAKLAKKTFDETFKGYAIISSFHAEYIESVEQNETVEEIEESEVENTIEV